MKPGISTPNPAIIPTQRMPSHTAEGTRSSRALHVPRTWHERVSTDAVATCIS